MMSPSSLWEKSDDLRVENLSRRSRSEKDLKHPISRLEVRQNPRHLHPECAGRRVDMLPAPRHNALRETEKLLPQMVMDLITRVMGHYLAYL